MTDYSELKKKISEFKACGKTTGHGSSCEETWLCGPCLERKEMGEMVYKLIEENAAYRIGANCLMASIKRCTDTTIQDGKTMIDLMEENDRLRK